MSSGFVSSSELEEEKKKRQEEWERVRKPDDPAVAPEPEVCHKSLFEQLRDNKEAKQAEIDEAKKFSKYRYCGIFACCHVPFGLLFIACSCHSFIFFLCIQNEMRSHFNVSSLPLF
ncbi:hypothetical protein ANCCAN_03414 [Ancylostoma caninum]|uniref:FAM192A/Fyv6 N-terminal domain-containing protein n=1 Tax=Ancylostoma caninum TaxID=29170 RepID=A0A368H5H1_ANCCA|nr:hypothetical protein ANCCAN_03414 [Ancylostoma caninum]